MDVPRRSFTSAMTRPMSFIELALISAMMSRIFASRLGIVELRGQEAFDNGDFALLGSGAVLAAALTVEFGALAALLDHLLEDFGD